MVKSYYRCQLLHDVLVLLLIPRWNLRNLLGDEEVSMCLWLASGWPPQMKVKDLRATNRGNLNLDWFSSCFFCEYDVLSVVDSSEPSFFG